MKKVAVPATKLQLLIHYRPQSEGSPYDSEHKRNRIQPQGKAAMGKGFVPAMHRTSLCIAFTLISLFY